MNTIQCSQCSMPQRGGMSIDIDNFMHTFLLIWCGYTGQTQAEAASSLLLLILEKKTNHVSARQKNSNRNKYRRSLQQTFGNCVNCERAI